MARYIEIIEKCTEARFMDEYLYLNITYRGEGTEAGVSRRRIDKETFRVMLNNRDGWMQNKRIVNGIEVPFVIRMVEG
ncbi:MAG: hypothetical protein KF870_07400 [Leadbetterella sp.]|nr:hypothetical protein [Leadbetterella sp.]